MKKQPIPGSLHLSAYTSDGKIADEQLELLLCDMQAEYEAGNYVIGGGDFNKDLLEGGSEAYFGVSTEDYTKACVDFYQQFYGFDASSVL